MPDFFKTINSQIESAPLDDWKVYIKWHMLHSQVPVLPTAFLKENEAGWPQLFEEGGLESRYAVSMGVQTLPMMILIDKQGKVVNRSVQGASLLGEVQKLLK